MASAKDQPWDQLGRGNPGLAHPDGDGGARQREMPREAPRPRAWKLTGMQFVTADLQLAIGSL